MEIRFPLILDGATGTELQKRGYGGDVSAEQWTLEHPDVIVDIQRGYVAAGSQVLYTPTFGANRQKLEERSIFNQTADYNRRLAALSREAAGGKAWIAGDLAPTGLFLAPLGEASFEDLVDIYTEQAAGLEAAGVDLYVIETMMTLSDARAAVLAVRSVSDKPIFVSFTCDESGRSLSGTDVTAALTVLQGMGISAFGLNCSTGPEQMLVQLRRLREYARVPLIAKPNAGMPITVGGKTYRISGLIAYVNYATLHEKATDLMFDALKFDVAMVAPGGFARLQKPVHYVYAWQYADVPADETAEKALSDDFLRALLTQTVVAENDLEDYTPRYANPAINFAPDDMGSDEAMGGVLLDILIVIIAFIFAVTINNTITKEASAIGTLRASGYTRGELVRHYLAMPVIVTLAAACVGNVLGYTVFKNVVVSMYYNSYSLPTYKTVWNPDAFLRTTLIPVVLMFVVNFLIITRMMRHTPLQFLRHDLKKARRKKALRLPNWSFFARFRLRIIYQNIANYLILFAGVFFIMVMLAMAIGMPSTLKYYQSRTADMMFTNYQYVLKSCEDENGDAVTTQNPDAEAFCMTSLVRKSDVLDEEVSVYGIADGSRYVQIDNLSGLEGNKVYISAPYADKYRLAVGDTFTLDEKYESKQYTFTVAGIYDRCQSIAVFLPMDHYRDIFDLDADAFSGFLSDTEITDIDEDNVATVITERDITKMADQLDHSMGSYMTYFQYLCVLLSAVLIYLLTKLIIEKNENAISMVKILGYENREIARLYLLSTTIVLVLIDAVSVWLGAAAMKLAWREIMFSYSGWFAFHMEPAGYVKMFVFVLLGYAIVTIFDFRRIRKIPMDEALKSAE